MCGIAGFVGQGDAADLARMNDRLWHRGPDAQGTAVDLDRRVFLAHRRLSIIDLATGAQPMWTADRQLVVVFNGEIYNHEVLRKELKALGHVFQTDHSDTEVLLHGYRQWGTGLASRLNGMWAFALYDLAKGSLWLSKDRFGKKPLFYSLQNGTFAFSSELSSLRLHPSIRSNLDPLSLRKYYAYGFIPSPRSLYQHVSKLPGGHNLVLDVATLEHRVERYWEFSPEPAEYVPANAEEQWCEQLRALLRDAVQRRLMSDVPLGIFLSGGVDSSSVTAIAAGLVNQPLQTFSIGFDEAGFDESPYAQIVASQYRTEHHVRRLSVTQARQLMPEIASKLDEPMGDSSLIPTYLLCAAARERVTVALGGDGGDELFCGYDPFKAIRLAQLYSRIVPRPVHQALCFLAARLPTGHGYMALDFKIKRMLRGLSHRDALWNPVWLGPLGPLEVQELCSEPIDPDELYSEAIEIWDSCAHLHPVDRTMCFYAKLYMQDDILVKVDRASMMHSLEVRSPLLDIELVNFVRKIPWTFKLRGGTGKYLLKKAMEPLLPREILYRSKQGFAMPVGQWMKDGSLELSSQPPAPGLSQAFIQSRIDQHRSGTLDARHFLWNHWVLGRHR